MISSIPTTSTIRRVMVVNYSGFIVGDDAIFEALKDLVRKACGPDVVIDALTAAPERTRARYPDVADVDHIYEYLGSAQSRRRILTMITQADLILIGGGDIVEGQLSMVILTALANLAGVPIAYVGVGVLKPADTHQRRLLRWSLNRACFVATRDSGSTELLRAMGVTRPRIQTLPDLAAGLDANVTAVADQLLAAEGVTRSRPYVAINLRTPDPGQYDMTWGESEYTAIAAMCQALVDRDDYDIVCVPLVIGAADPLLLAGEQSDDDLMFDVARRIARPGRVHVLRHDYRPKDLARIIGEARLAIGMRLHFLMLAANGNVPLLALSYARKVRAFMHSMGLERYCLDMVDVNSHSLEYGVMRLESERDAVSERLSSWRAEAGAQLMTLAPLIASLVEQGASRHSARRRLGRTGASTLLLALQVYSSI